MIPRWYFISVVETKDPQQLTTKFNELCCLQRGALNHGWRVVSFSPTRYLFQFISEEPLNQDTIFDLVMLCEDSGTVISECTNLISEPDAPQYNLITIVDTGYKVIGRNPILEELEQQMQPGTVNFRGEIMTVITAHQTLSEALIAQKKVERYIKDHGQMTIITTFKNWKE